MNVITKLALIIISLCMFAGCVFAPPHHKPIHKPHPHPIVKHVPVR
jgi:hypothetical protein